MRGAPACLQPSFAIGHPDALVAEDDSDRARHEIAIARARLLERADKLSPEVRESFMRAVPEHVETFDLARTLVG